MTDEEADEDVMRRLYSALSETVAKFAKENGGIEMYIVVSTFLKLASHLTSILPEEARLGLSRMVEEQFEKIVTETARERAAATN